MGSWQWGYKDNDMWLLGFPTEVRNRNKWHDRSFSTFQGDVRFCSQDQHAPTSSKRWKIMHELFQREHTSKSFEAQINGWICVLAHWSSLNHSHEMHPMLKCCSGPLEWFAQKIVGWNHWPIHICSTTQQAYTGLEASETGMKETKIHPS